MKQQWNVIGLMSGTSLDGIDLVYTSIFKENGEYSYQILNSKTIPYPKKWEDTLRNAFYSSEYKLKQLDKAYGVYLGEVVNEFIQNNSLKNIDFIASHGHTVFHKPNEGFTLQIGNGQQISNTTNLKVVCDFRTQDVLLGGQGAPLVPIGDKLLFSEYDYCLNLGGFSNISFDKNNERIAFDICPVNIVLNYYVKQLGFNFDDKGEVAKSGNINSNLLKALNSISFYSFPIPKSLGFEFVEEEIIPLINSFKLPVKDILRTLVAHISEKIVEQLKNSTSKKMLVTGGGAYNEFLIEEITRLTNCNIVTPSNVLIDFKEALIFAFLGVLRLENQVNCLRSVTGAKKNHSSGKIFAQKS